jgi:hypothetical protein
MPIRALDRGECVQDFASRHRLAAFQQDAKDAPLVRADLAGHALRIRLLGKVATFWISGSSHCHVSGIRQQRDDRLLMLLRQRFGSEEEDDRTAGPVAQRGW